MIRKNIYISLLAACLVVAAPSVNAKMTKEAHALYQQACSYEYKSDYNTAINIIQKALEINGEDAMLYTKIAGLYSDIGQYENALTAYKKAVHLRPNDAFIYISIGNILQTMGDYENAYKSFYQAQTIYPEYKYNYLNLANIEYFRKNYDTATEYYNTFLSAYPEHMEASENLANVYYLSNQPEKACDIYSTLYKKYPSEEQRRKFCLRIIFRLLGILVMIVAVCFSVFFVLVEKRIIALITLLAGIALTVILSKYRKRFSDV